MGLLATTSTHSTNVSDALVWSVIKKQNNKTLRRTHPDSLSTVEKGSLCNTVRRRDSGLGNTAAVDVSANDDGVPVLSLRNRDPAASRSPDKMWLAVTLSGGVRKALRRAEIVLAQYPDTVRAHALRRISQIYLAKARKDRGMNHATLLAAAQ